MVTTNSMMLGITQTVIRRAVLLRNSVGAADPGRRLNLDADVALVVSCEEYAALAGDPALWNDFTNCQVKFGNPTEFRICGILVLPR